MASAVFMDHVVSLIPIFLVAMLIERSTSFTVFQSSTLPHRPYNVIRWSASPDDDDSTSTVPPVLVVDSMPERFSHLRHTYYLLRHGQSTANIASIISSDRYALAYTDRHGLTAVGYDQGRGAAQDLLDLLLLQEEKLPIAFVSSPFARARQTAEACQGELQDLVKEDEATSFDILDDISIHDGLMERSFGRLDGEEIRTYAYVWPLDKFNVTHTAFDVESVAAVCTRFRQTILDIEMQLSSPHTVVLASHADVLQIAQLYAAGVENVGEFSSYRFQSKYYSTLAQQQRLCASL